MMDHFLLDHHDNVCCTKPGLDHKQLLNEHQANKGLLEVDNPSHPQLKNWLYLYCFCFFITFLWKHQPNLTLFSQWKEREEKERKEIAQKYFAL